ncbi:hypothetical protein HYPSUDRAFT_79765 [Hypholoma sublateritium FD-334 SS-4]|uniref:Uncharacterized protein n=1 Tax=Hypholoma sublateritium (strain FD-334 SS-4) TaxID=945553 RepID=A0A0D2PAD8_HYPSF|nr:hypothetical protein HYPSUDRAFT_79765 [Hypholoma sublateritium FD-334 SS-4]
MMLVERMRAQSKVAKEKRCARKWVGGTHARTRTPSTRGQRRTLMDWNTRTRGMAHFKKGCVLALATARRDYKWSPYRGARRSLIYVSPHPMRTGRKAPYGGRACFPLGSVRCTQAGDVDDARAVALHASWSSGEGLEEDGSECKICTKVGKGAGYQNEARTWYKRFPGRGRALAAYSPPHRGDRSRSTNNATAGRTRACKGSAPRRWALRSCNGKDLTLPGQRREAAVDLRSERSARCEVCVAREGKGIGRHMVVVSAQAEHDLKSTLALRRSVIAGGTADADARETSMRAACEGGLDRAAAGWRADGWCPLRSAASDKFKGDEKEEEDHSHVIERIIMVVFELDSAGYKADCEQMQPESAWNEKALRHFANSNAAERALFNMDAP